MDFENNYFKPPKFVKEVYPFSREIVINFDRELSATDIMTADACFGVYTSDGEKGTINHLFQNTDAIQFVRDLKERLGDVSAVSVIIAGGWNKYPMSKKLGQELIDELGNAGFTLEYADVGGNYHRRGTLYSDRVEIAKTPHGPEQTIENLVLKFKK